MAMMEMAAIGLFVPVVLNFLYILGMDSCQRAEVLCMEDARWARVLAIVAALAPLSSVFVLGIIASDDIPGQYWSTIRKGARVFWEGVRKLRRPLTPTEKNSLCNFGPPRWDI